MLIPPPCARWKPRHPPNDRYIPMIGRIYLISIYEFHLYLFCSNETNLFNVKNVCYFCIITFSNSAMCGKMKYGKGDPTKRRGAWVFGGIQRGEGGRAFMKVCPNNKRTKEALWPIIEENIAKETAIYSDGLASYRKLYEIGYIHRWGCKIKIRRETFI